jgi:hypothetical protein
MSTQEKTLLTSEQAVELLADGEDVHAFVNPGAMLIGADWSREEALDYINKAETRELAGPEATRMKHGLAVHGQRGLVFFATKEPKP